MQTSQKKKKTLPPLFGIDTKGKNRVWKCWVIDDTLFREHGLVTGKKILSERKFEGKSIGKKNETTPEEQAWMEANKEWIAHITKEYSPHPDDKEGMKLFKQLNETTKKTGGTNVNAVAAISKDTKVKNLTRTKNETYMVEDVQGGPVIPMKAQVWELDNEEDPYSVSQKVLKYFSIVKGKGKSMTLEPTEFFSQQKLDGWRCRVMLQKGENGHEIVMTTNSAKQYRWFSKLRSELLGWLSVCSKDDILDGLDGEIYAESLIDANGKAVSDESRFSLLCGICGVSRTNPHELENQIQFHCFDIIDSSSTLTQVERFQKRDNLFKKLPKEYTNIIKVETVILKTVQDVVEYHGKCAERGYEGCMLRTFNLKYVSGSRSSELRKFKLFKDAEYKIVGCKVDKGVAIEQFTWVLVTEGGNEFSAKPMGSKDEKLEWYKNRKEHIGKYATVKFQEFSEDKIPRFPIVKSFRAGVSTD